MTRAELVDRVARDLYDRYGDGDQDWIDFRIDAAAVVDLVVEGAEERVGDVFLRRMPPAHVARNVTDAVNAVLGEP